MRLIFLPMIQILSLKTNLCWILITGTLAKNQMIRVSPTIPAIDPQNFMWIRMVELTIQKGMFNFLVRNNKALELAE